MMGTLTTVMGDGCGRCVSLVCTCVYMLDSLFVASSFRRLSSSLIYTRISCQRNNHTKIRDLPLWLFEANTNV